MTSVNIRILTKKEFEKNRSFFQENFDEITLSIYPHLDKFQLIELSDYFEKHPINSFVFLTEGAKIVSIIYSSPLNDDFVYNDMGLEHWGINYVKTHKDYQRKGYVKKVMLFCLKDMFLKGAHKIYGSLEIEGLPLCQSVANELGLSSVETS